MIRYAYICNQVLQLYRTVPDLSFPLKPEAVFETLDNCKLMTYFMFSYLNQCSVERVMQICNSKSGCTHYDPIQNRYLVLYNSSWEDNNVEGRIRWTLAHELGHILLGHLPYVKGYTLSKDALDDTTDALMEAEADYFAASLLCPMPLFELLNVKSPKDIMLAFGLSTQAANYRWEEYERWRKAHRKTAYESELKRIFLEREANGTIHVSRWRDCPAMRGEGVIEIWKDAEELQ